MDMLARARKLEARIARTVDFATQRFIKPGEREPLEIMHAIVEAIETEVQAAGRGMRVFPFNRIRVSVVASSREARARLEAVLSGSPSLQERVVERLAAAGCDTRDLAIRVTYTPQAGETWSTREWHLEFDRVTPASAPPAPAPPPQPGTVTLMVLQGTADRSEHVFTQERIDLGRCTEVRDRRQRLLRRNHVAFADSEAPPNRTVSRRHAHIRFDPDTREYRLCDDHSEQGTSVVRSGRTIRVPPGSRGIRLQSDDEIVLGEARLRFSVG